MKYKLINPIRYPSNSKLSPSPYTLHESPSNPDSIQSSSQQQPPAKHSMLDKLKLFNKDKDRSKSSKRTSSSSGFSSARSDSSLSLNNDPNTSSIAVPKGSKKNEILNGANKTSSANSKSSKIASNASPRNAKDTPAPVLAMKSQSKSDKKKIMEISVEQQQQPVSKLQQQKMLSVKFQPQQISQIQQQQQMLVKQQQQHQQQHQQQAYRKVEIRTDMKSLTGLPQPQAKIIIQPLTNIPKPMAAIKGQSKAQIKADENFADVIKLDKAMIDNHHKSSMSLNSGEQKTQIVNPITMDPLHNQLRLQNGQIHASSQSMSDSVHSASTNNHSNSSESSVIYRPSASESGSEFYHSNISHSTQQQHRNPIPNRKVDHFNDALLTNGHKFNTIPSKLNGAATTIGNNQTMFGEEQQKATQGAQQGGSAVVPLRSIMRGYNNQQQQQHVTTLPTRGARSGQNLVNGYYDEHHNQGYCSDGDALRKTPIRYTDIENGYHSESGVTNPHFMSIFRNRPQLPSTITEER